MGEARRRREAGTMMSQEEQLRRWREAVEKERAIQRRIAERMRRMQGAPLISIEVSDVRRTPRA